MFTAMELAQLIGLAALLIFIKFVNVPETEHDKETDINTYIYNSFAN